MPTSAAKAGMAVAQFCSSLAKAFRYCAVIGASNSAADKGSWARNGSLRPRRTRSPIGRPLNFFAPLATLSLTQIRVPSALFAASSLAAVLIVSP